MSAGTMARPRQKGEVAVERATAGLMLANAVVLVALPYSCPAAIREGLVGGEGFYATCSMALSAPFFPEVFLLAALDAALAVWLLWRGRSVRRWVLLRMAIGTLAWGTLALLEHGNPYAVGQFVLSTALLFLLGSLVIRLLFPGAFWLVVFFAAPLFIVLVYSFLRRGPYGAVDWTWNLRNYTRFFDPLYLSIFGRSFRIATITTLICFLFGYPLAYFIARRPPRWRNVLLLLLMVPFWTNFVVRTYAWKLILSDEGLLNQFWTVHLHGATVWLNHALGGGLGPLANATARPLSLLYTEWAVIIGLVYGWITDMTLPCYAAIERVDFALVEAAKDLYANDLRSFVRVVLPLSMPGIVAGAILVFIPSLGAYVTPDMLGGAKTMMIGNLIQQQFLSVRDYPFGSAISFVLMTIMLVGTLIYFRAAGRRL